MLRYKHVESGGYTFVFKNDPDDESLLHIYARHLTTVHDFLRTWFDPGAEEWWDEEHERFETRSETHILLWYWLKQDERVMVITCMTTEG